MKLTQAAKKRIARIEWPVDRVPKVCEVNLNYSCNAKCLFCYNPLDQAGFASMEMSFDQAARALYSGRKEGCWIACLIGGEPTLREDLGRLAMLARKIGFECVKIVSNGIRLADRAYVRRLAESGVNCFNISVHGHTPAIHDRLVGVPGAFKKTAKAMENARAVGKQVGVDHVFTKANAKTFPKYFELMLVDREINYFNMIYPHYRGIMAKNAERLRVSYTELAPHIRKAMALFTRHKLPALSRVLVNFTPCVLPGLEHIMADWERSSPSGSEPLFGPGGDHRMDEMKALQKAKPPACSRCVYDKRCMGVDREYLHFYGESEFVPLRRIPKRAPIEALYLKGKRS